VVTTQHFAEACNALLLLRVVDVGLPQLPEPANNSTGNQDQSEQQIEFVALEGTLA
jgi:hypothetical protein